jgi:hypothetical protein
LKWKTGFRIPKVRLQIREVKELFSTSGWTSKKQRYNARDRSDKKTFGVRLTNPQQIYKYTDNCSIKHACIPANISLTNLFCGQVIQKNSTVLAEGDGGGAHG